MPRAATHEAGEYTVMGSKLLLLTEGRPGSVENPPVYEEYTEGEKVHLSATDASRHAVHQVAVFVNPDSDHDRRVRMVPMIVPVGDEDKALSEGTTPEGVAVVVPPDQTPPGPADAETPTLDQPPGGPADQGPGIVA